MIELWKVWVGVCAGLATIISTSAYFVHAARKLLKDNKDIRDGIKCVLRKDMMDTYYANREDETLREYEKKNFIYEYNAYKALDGNSFVDDINVKVRTWDVEQ